MSNKILESLKKARLKIHNPRSLAIYESLLRQYFANITGKIQGSEIQSLTTRDLITYTMIPENSKKKGKELLSKLVVIKLNGGLGTTMGLTYPKSLVKINNSQGSFIDIVYQHLQGINKKNNTCIPLYLMDTEKSLKKTIESFGNPKGVYHFSQHEFPRLDKDTGLPFTCQNKEIEWAPPGHGDIYASLEISGTLNHLIEQGFEYAFISNSDNLGATVDYKILGYMHDQSIPFILESTPRTALDTKGGTLIRYKDRLSLLERTQMDDNNMAAFEDANLFPIFNTNNIWVNLKTLKHMVNKQFPQLPLIVNEKIIENKPCVQLETAAGAAISNFENAISIIVGRDRFLPVKQCSDLLVLRSDVIENRDGQIVFHPSLNPKLPPKITLSSEYKSLGDFESRFIKIPSLKKCASLEISGDFLFESDVKIEGHVTLINKTKKQAKISHNILQNETICIE